MRAGTLSLTAPGGLDGHIQVTIVGLEQVLQMLYLNRMVPQADINVALDTLDQIVLRFGQFARQNAAPGVVAGLRAMGQGTTLEGKAAVVLPLRFVDGAVFFGQVPIALTPQPRGIWSPHARRGRRCIPVARVLFEFLSKYIFLATSLFRHLSGAANFGGRVRAVDRLHVGPISQSARILTNKGRGPTCGTVSAQSR
jgi:hypothetical protein